MDTETSLAVNLGFEILLGGQKHKVRKLSIARSREWRKKASELDKKRITAIENNNKPVEGVSESLTKGIATNEIVFNLNPDYVTELVVDFCAGQGPLTREWIEQNATDEEISAAFQLILGTVLPLEMITGGQLQMQKVMTPPVKGLTH